MNMRVVFFYVGGALLLGAGVLAIVADMTKSPKPAAASAAVATTAAQDSAAKAQ